MKNLLEYEEFINEFVKQFIINRIGHRISTIPQREQKQDFKDNKRLLKQNNKKNINLMKTDYQETKNNYNASN